MVVVMVLMGNVLVEKASGSADGRCGRRGWRSSVRGLWRLVVVAPVVLIGALGVGVVPALAGEASCVKVEEPLRKHEEQLRLEDHSTRLPDCRSYELVTAPYKDGYQAFFDAISQDGSRAIFNSLGTFGGAEGNHVVEGTMYVSQRTPSGWQPKAVTLPASSFPFSSWIDASPDLSRTLWTGHTATQSSEVENIYVREADGSVVLVGPMLPPEADKAPPSPYPSKDSGEVKYQGASPDLSRIYFESSQFENTVRWPSDETLSGPSLYEFTGVGNSEPKLVGVSNNSTFNHNSEAKLITQCGVELGGPFSEYNAISTSHDSVFFTANAATCGGSGPVANEVYARVDKAETVHISEPLLEDCATCNTSDPAEAVFAGASEDGAKGFFLSEQSELLPTAKGMNLYEYDLNGPVHDRLVRVAEAVAEPGVLGVARISADGSHVYFVANGVLAANKNSNNGEAVEGADNMYVFDSVTGTTTFIGILSSEDEEVWAANDDGRPVQTTPDGKFAIFASRAHLTPDDQSGEDVAQLFEYDDETGELVRISVGQKGNYFCAATGKTEPGYNCDGNTETKAYQGEPASFKLSFKSARAIQADRPSISSDGSTITFQSNNALTPQAENSLSSKLCSNVYEYRWGGKMSAGDVFLLSDGQDVTFATNKCGASILGMDPSGADVMVASTDKLVSQDTDTQRDYYDARETGGFPATVPPVGCGEACQGGLAISPLLLSPNSTVPAGAGNLASPATKLATQKTARSLSRKQKLAKALAACRKEPRKKRAACKALVRKKYKARAARRSTDNTHVKVATGRAK